MRGVRGRGSARGGAPGLGGTSRASTRRPRTTARASVVERRGSPGADRPGSLPDGGSSGSPPGRPGHRPCRRPEAGAVAMIRDATQAPACPTMPWADALALGSSTTTGPRSAGPRTPRRDLRSWPVPPARSRSTPLGRIRPRRRPLTRVVEAVEANRPSSPPFERRLTTKAGLGRPDSRGSHVGRVRFAPMIPRRRARVGFVFLRRNSRTFVPRPPSNACPWGGRLASFFRRGATGPERILADEGDWVRFESAQRQSEIRNRESRGGIDRPMRPRPIDPPPSAFSWQRWPDPPVK